MIEFRRFLHPSLATKAAMESFKRVPTIVHPKRNNELIQYQKNLKDQRQVYRQELATKYPTKAAIKAEQRQTRAEARNSRWSEYLGKVKRAYADPDSPIYSNRHPCRPIVHHSKSITERQDNCRRLADSRKQVQVMRRKYLCHLSQVVAGEFITKENLVAKIQHALNNPVSYNTIAEEIVQREKNLKLSLRQYHVEADKAVVPQLKAYANANCSNQK